MNAVDQALEAVVERVVRRVVREELAAERARPAGELATVATFARDHAISVSTVELVVFAVVADVKLGGVVVVFETAVPARPRRATVGRRRQLSVAFEGVVTVDTLLVDFAGGARKMKESK